MASNYVGVDIGERNFGYAVVTLKTCINAETNEPLIKPRMIRIGTRDFKLDNGSSIKEIVHRMIKGFHELLQEFLDRGEKVTVAIELQGKMIVRNRICQHALCAYLDTLEMLGLSSKGMSVPTSRFVEPRDKFRVTASGGQLKLLSRDEIEVMKNHGNRKNEAVQRAKQLIPLILEHPEEGLQIQEKMDDHMADALLTALYVILRDTTNPIRGEKRASTSTEDVGGNDEKKVKLQWSFS